MAPHYLQVLEEELRQVDLEINQKLNEELQELDVEMQAKLLKKANSARDVRPWQRKELRDVGLKVLCSLVISTVVIIAGHKVYRYLADTSS